MLLCDGAAAIVEYRWPDYLELESVRHSDRAYTIVLLDLDYRYYTFRLSLSLDDRWTVVPISGFDTSVSMHDNEIETVWKGAEQGWQRAGS